LVYGDFRHFQQYFSYIVGRMHYRNVRGYRRGNHKWTIQRNWQHRVHEINKVREYRRGMQSQMDFSNVYLSCIRYVASFSVLSICDCMPLRYPLTFIYLVYPMLPVSLYCSFVIASLVSSNVYLSFIPYVASFSVLSICDCMLLLPNILKLFGYSIFRF
jgi:hypothetical protein